MENLDEIVKSSNSLAEVCRRLGKENSGSFQSKVKKEIFNRGLDINHFTGQLWSKGKDALSDERLKRNEIFVENSKANKSYVRRLVLKNKLIDYKCSCGNNGSWMGKEISLELDHINGDPRDQRLDNLRFLCPNCHSITPTYCSKNQKHSKKKITDQEIIDSYSIHKNIHRTLKSLGIENGRNYSRVNKLISENSSLLHRNFG